MSKVEAHLLRCIIAATFCVFVSCSEDSQNNGDNGNDDTDDETLMADGCIDLLGCATLVDSQMLGTLEEMYGENSGCWEDPSVAQECQEMCADSMEMLLLDSGWDFPWNCNADAPTKSNQINTLDGVTWEEVALNPKPRTQKASCILPSKAATPGA